jgi:hypothetical protein
MADLSFAAYAEARGYGSLQLPANGPEQDSYFVDLRLMEAQARGAEQLSGTDRDGRFFLRAGITLESAINGLAEIVEGVHYSSVTFGYCLASLYAAETLMGSDVLPDCGVPGRPPDRDLDILPADALLVDPSRAVAILLGRQTSDPERADASRFISHIMFLFAYLHEFQHCALGHCLELQERAAPARLCEIGTRDERKGVDLRLYHGFELLADGHACDGVMHTIFSQLDLPTREGLIDASEPMKCRLAVLAMSLSAALWHALDSRRTVEDWQHPQPVIRLINLMARVHLAMVRRYGPDAATDFNKQWLQDLREIAFRSSTVYGAYCNLHRTYTPDILQTIDALRKEQQLLIGRFHFSA